MLCSNADFKTKNRRFCSDLSLGVLDLNILDLATLVLGNDEVIENLLLGRVGFGVSRQILQDC